MEWVDNQVSTNQQISQLVLAPDTRPRAENAVYVHVESCPGLKRLTRRQVNIEFIKYILFIGQSTEKAEKPETMQFYLGICIYTDSCSQQMNMDIRPRDLITS